MPNARNLSKCRAHEYRTPSTLSLWYLPLLLASYPCSCICSKCTNWVVSLQEFCKQLVIPFNLYCLLGETAYVLTKSLESGFLLWNASTGVHYGQHQPHIPLVSVGCIFNGTNVSVCVCGVCNILLPKCNFLGVGKYSDIWWSKQTDVWFFKSKTVVPTVFPVWWLWIIGVSTARPTIFRNW